MVPIFSQLWIKCDVLVSDGPTNDIKERFFVETNLFEALVLVKCMELHCIKIPPKQLIRHKFLKDEFLKAAKEIQQNHGKLEQKQI